jgi:tetratricopeptide (TPR) repeat protein
MKAYQWMTAALLAGTVVMVAPTSNVWAQDPDAAKKVEQLSIQARERYNAKDYAGAIALFEQAYAIEPIPALLYNIARCYEKMENWKKAIEYYEKFVVSPDVESEVRQSAMARSRELREIVDAENKLKNQDNNNNKNNNNNNGNGDNNSNGKQTPPPEPDRTVAYVVMGTGGALVLGGVVMGVLANGAQSDFDSATNSADKLAARDSGQTYALGADILYGAGAVALGVGLFLFLTAEPEAPAQGKTTTELPVHVWFGQGAAGVDMTWRF